MSALFQHGQGELSRDETVARGLELREIPVLFEVDEYVDPDRGNVRAAGVLSNLFTKLSTNWMYSAIIQLALNGSQPPWSLDGWSFVPLDLSSVINNGPVQNLRQESQWKNIPMETNVSVSTPALRGSIKCTPYDERKLQGNHSTWFREMNLTDAEVWDVSSNPKGLGKGYWFNAALASSGRGGNLFDTSVLSNGASVTCCANGTG